MREIVIEELGEGVDSAVFAAWLASVGDTVAEGEVIAEVMTDKVNVEIESPCAGVVESLECQPDDEVTIGQVIARVREAQ